MNKVLVLSGNYRPNFRDMVEFKGTKDATREWEKDRNTRILDRTGNGGNLVGWMKGVRKKEFGPRSVVK